MGGGIGGDGGGPDILYILCDSPAAGPSEELVRRLRGTRWTVCVEMKFIRTRFLALIPNSLHARGARNMSVLDLTNELTKSQSQEFNPIELTNSKT